MSLVRDRLLLLRQLRPAGVALVALVVVLLLVQAALPAITALVVAWVVDAVQAGRIENDPLAHAALPLALLGLALLGGQVASALVKPLNGLARGRIDGAHRAALATLAVSTATTAEQERPVNRDRMRVASAEVTTSSDKPPGEGALAQLSLLIRYVGAAMSAAVVATHSWWLVPALVLPALVIRSRTRAQWLGMSRLQVRGASDGRRADYWRDVMTSPAEGKELRVFGIADWVHDRRQEHVLRRMDPVWSANDRALSAQWVTFLLISVPLAAVFLSVAWDTAQGLGSIAREAAVLTAAWGVFAAITPISDGYAIEGALPVVRARGELAEALPPGPMIAGPEPGPVPPLIRAANVSFRYPGADRPVLDGLDLTVEPGELLAVVGMNGAGKSTLIRLLTGQYEPTGGVITANGVPIADPAAGGLPGWRGRIAVVFQDFVRYQLTVADNVALGAARRGPVDQAALEAVAEQTGLAEVVERLPNGWDTPLARSRTGGVDLSGGQWQQVVLARALYAVRNGARVLVLDEPTAHLDVRTEIELFGKLTRLAGDITVVLISHRLSSVREAGRIVVLDGGRIAESGSHEELMGEGGRYAAMFATQAKRFRGGYDDRFDDEDGT